MPHPASFDRSRQTRRVRRVAAIATAVSAAVIAQGTGAVPVAAATSAVTPSTSVVTAPMDYFTNQWNNPIDFSDAADFDVSRLQVPSGSALMNDGRLQLSGVGQVFFVRHDAGAAPTSAVRDPRTRDLDAATYSRISFRMHSDRSAYAALGYRSCDNCADGYRYFEVFRGWHTYDLDMVGETDLEPAPPGVPRRAGAPWSGKIDLLFMSPGFNTPDKPTLTLDDFMIYQPSPGVALTLGGGSGSLELWSDSNNNTSDDGDVNGVGASANRLGAVAAGSTIYLSTGSFRPDQPLRFYTSQNGQKSAFSATVSMPSTSSPSPVVFSPSEGGGHDFATEVRGDAWDFDQPSDVFKTFNANAWVSEGALHATAGGVRNDPVVVLNSGATQIDATLYHKAAITIVYEGPFGLEDAPGGGLVGRLVWRGFDGGHEQVSEDIVVKPGRHTYVVDLRTSPAAAILDPAGNREFIGWGTSWTTFVSLLRFDPHEDPGNRVWHLEDFKLLRDDAVAPTFTVQYADNTWAPGTVADIWADTNRSRADGLGWLLDGGVPVASGTNNYVWDGHNATPGSYFIHVVLRRNGREVGATSGGQVANGVGGAGPAPAAAGDLAHAPAPPTAGPTHEQLVAFFNFILTTKFLCGVARQRNIAWMGKAPICNQLLGPWPAAKAKSKGKAKARKRR